MGIRTIVFLMLLGLIYSPPSQACSCGGFRSVTERALSSEVVFYGRVKSVGVPWLLQPTAMSLLPDALWVGLVEITRADVVTEIEVIHAWKGVTTDSFMINSGKGWCCDCSVGLRYTPGDAALFFTNSDGDISLCNWPSSESDIDEVTEVLGDPIDSRSLQPLPLYKKIGGMDRLMVCCLGLILLIGLGWGVQRFHSRFRPT